MLKRDLLALANLLVKLSREKIRKLTVWLTHSDSDKRQHPCIVRCMAVHMDGFRRVWSLWVWVAVLTKYSGTLGSPP